MDKVRTVPKFLIHFSAGDSAPCLSCSIRMNETSESDAALTAMFEQLMLMREQGAYLLVAHNESHQEWA